MIRRRPARFLLTSLALLLAFGATAVAPASGEGGPPAQLRSFRWDSKPGTTRLIFEFDRLPDYTATDDQRAHGYLYVDVAPVVTGLLEDENVWLGDERVTSMRRRVFGDQQVLRVIIDTTSVRLFRVQTLENPARLLVDVFDAEGRGVGSTTSLATKAPPTRPRTVSVPAAAARESDAVHTISTSYVGQPILYKSNQGGRGRPLTIVIDPGHGGSSHGAASKTKFGGAPALEKTLALGISLELKKLIDADPNMQCVMTRTSDKAVSLEERVDFAEARRGDLFVSVHLNAATGAARGCEFFYLSPKGQGQLKGRIVRSMEKSGGSKRGKAIVERMAGEKVNDLARRSQSLCESISREFNKVTHYKSRNRGVKNANFYVLKNAVSPAVLIEVGFMTDATDVSRLVQKKYQQEAARSIYNAIRASLGAGVL